MINPNEVQKEEPVPVAVENPKKLDLAIGNAPKVDGFLGVDIVKTDSTDIVADLTKPWPFEDNSIDEARCHHFFEHLEPHERVHFMNELYRVLKPGAGCIFLTPRGYERQVMDFSHKWPPIVVQSYLYFDKAWLTKEKLTHYADLHGIKCDFEFRPLQMTVTPEFSTKNEEHKLFATRHYANAVVDLIVLMVKRPVQ